MNTLLDRIILLVEDDTDGMAVISGMVVQWGAQAVCMPTADEALVWLGAEVPDLAIVDLKLPGMDGLSLLRQMRADSRLSRVPVILLSAFMSDQVQRETLHLKNVKYLTKPIDPAAMQRAMRDLAV